MTVVMLVILVAGIGLMSMQIGETSRAEIERESMENLYRSEYRVLYAK